MRTSSRKAPEIRSLQSQLRSHTRSRPATTVRYPARLREAVVTLARRRAQAGTSVRRTAHELGMRPTTLYLWLRAAPARKFRPVAVADPPESSELARPAPGSPVLVTPAGYRIEGLDPAGLATLLRALA